MKKTVLVLFLISLIGCIEVRSQRDDKKPEQSTAVRPTQSRDENISWTWRPLQPNQYELEFQISSELVTQQLFVIKKTNERTQSLAMVLNSEGKWVDSEVKPLEKINYEVAIMLNGHYETIKKIDVQVPMDFVISENFNLEPTSNVDKEKFTEFKFERIIFLNKAVMTTNGAKVRFIAKEIISENGILQTFPENQKANLGIDGRSGGEIEMIAQKATGNLRVELRGENGGDGVPGRLPDRQLKGQKGQKGNAAHFDVECRASATGGIIYPCENRFEICRLNPTDGAPGGKGFAGYPGGDAKNGGASGIFGFRVHDQENFDLMAMRFPGLHGRGGAGGPGGEGGDGGDPGDKSSCTAALAGPTGSNGDSGPVGHDGYDGQIQSICISKGETQTTCY